MNMTQKRKNKDTSVSLEKYLLKNFDVMGVSDYQGTGTSTAKLWEFVD